MAVIVQDGLNRMYQQEENVFYYIMAMNEKYLQPAMPEGVEEGILKGMYLFKKAGKSKIKVQLLGGGAILRDAQQLSDVQIKTILVKESVESYLETVSDCPCPYNRDRAGRLCGKRSAWSRGGGKSPLCSPSDVTKGMIEDYRKNNAAAFHGTEDTGLFTTGTEDPSYKGRQ